MPGGNEGTDISKVANPVCLSHCTNQSSSLCLGWRNQMPLPAKGRVPGGRLWPPSAVTFLQHLEIVYGSLLPLRRIADLWPWRNHIATRTAKQSAMPYIIIRRFPRREFNQSFNISKSNAQSKDINLLIPMFWSQNKTCMYGRVPGYITRSESPRRRSFSYSAPTGSNLWIYLSILCYGILYPIDQLCAAYLAYLMSFRCDVTC